MDKIVQGADVQFSFPITDQSGAVLNLTGATVTFKTVDFLKTCTIDNAAGGIASVWVSPTDFTRSDIVYFGDLSITMPNGKIHKPFDQVKIFVRKAV